MAKFSNESGFYGVKFTFQNFNLDKNKLKVTV